MKKAKTSGGTRTPIKTLREEIDALDEKIQTFISERAQLALDIAETKQQEGSNNFYRPEREAEVLRKVLERNRGPLSNETMAQLLIA